VLARLAGEEEHLPARETAQKADLGQGGDVRSPRPSNNPNAASSSAIVTPCIITSAAILRSTDLTGQGRHAAEGA
jgi:hypothetical protein